MSTPRLWYFDEQHPPTADQRKLMLERVEQELDNVKLALANFEKLPDSEWTAQYRQACHLADMANRLQRACMSRAAALNSAAPRLNKRVVCGEAASA